MNRRLALWTAFGIATLIAGRASAQTTGGQGEVTIGYQGLPHKASGETATGIQVSEGVLLHVGAGAETGYDTNVFYTNVAPIASPILGTSLFGDLSNSSRTGVASRVSFNARAGLVYRRYLSDNPAVQNFSSAWMPTAGLALSLGGGQIGFGLADTFARIEDPPYNPGTLFPITRYNNQASVEGRWAPGGGRLTATLRYTNMIDVFEGLRTIKVFAAEERGFLHCLDAKTGEHYWKDDLKTSVWGSPYYVDGKVMIGCQDGSLFVFAHGKTKKLINTIDHLETIEGTPVVANGVLYIATRTKLIAIVEKK
jgi:hypothetical protein